MEVIGRGSDHDRRRLRVRDRRLGDQGPPAADDQRRRAPLAAGRLPLRPPPPPAPRDADAPRDPGRRRSRLVVAGRRTRPWRGPRATGTLGPAIRARNERQEGSRGAGGTETSGEGGSRRPQPRAAARRTPPGSGPAPTLRILETRILRGPNYWAREPVVRMLVDLGVLEEYPSNKIPGFNDALIELLPSLEDHACSSAGAAASSPGSRRARGSATSPSTSRSSSRTSPAPTSATARPAAPASTATTT